MLTSAKENLSSLKETFTASLQLKTTKTKALCTLTFQNMVITGLEVLLLTLRLNMCQVTKALSHKLSQKTLLVSLLRTHQVRLSTVSMLKAMFPQKTIASKPFTQTNSKKNSSEGLTVQLNQLNLRM